MISTTLDLHQEEEEDIYIYIIGLLLSLCMSFRKDRLHLINGYILSRLQQTKQQKNFTLPNADNKYMNNEITEQLLLQNG